MKLHYILLLLSSSSIAQSPRFEAQTIDSSISIGYGLAIADVDGDRKQDILLADKKQIVWYRNPDWKKTVIAENLTEFDNVCIAARDVNGDGKAEVAVGAQWNPGETSNDSLSGAVFYLERNDEPGKMWKAVKLHHEPTVHRMRWTRTSDGKHYLVVLPLHGRGNKGGAGAGVKVLAYAFPKNVNDKWKIDAISNDMHMTHNMFIDESQGGKTRIFIAGKEGVQVLMEPFSSTAIKRENIITGEGHSSGEIKVSKHFIALIQPMHGNKLSVYDNSGKRTILDTSFNEGHALGAADFVGKGHDQLVAGWRNPDKQQQVGIKIYSGIQHKWNVEWVDKNGMACEDLQVADLDGNGKPDIIASGRSTKNVKIYWNR